MRQTLRLLDVPEQSHNPGQVASLPANEPQHGSRHRDGKLTVLLCEQESEKRDDSVKKKEIRLIALLFS